MRRALIAALLTTVTGCGLWLGRYTNPDGETTSEKAGEPDSYTLEGEARDSTTMALVPDAVIDTWSDVPGYVPRATLDGRGGFLVTVVMVPRHNTECEQIGNGLISGDPYVGEPLVREIALRARTGTRCSPVIHREPRKLPRERFVLWLQDCGERDRTGWP